MVSSRLEKNAIAVERQVAATTAAATPRPADSNPEQSVMIPTKIVARTVNMLLHSRCVVPVLENVIQKRNVLVPVPYVRQTRLNPMVCDT